MLTSTPLPATTPLRDSITNAYRMDETACLNLLLPEASFSEIALKRIYNIAKNLVLETRAYKKTRHKIDVLLHQYDLSTDEGIALMCLAEALLRIPDKATIDKFISDKISTVAWQNHLNKNNPLFVNAATWSLLLSGKVYAPTLDHQKSLMATLKRTISRVGTTMIRPIVLQMMVAIGKQFVMGENIDAALKRAIEFENKGYRFSYDMLGEAARTEKDAKIYYDSYLTAIHAIGKVAHASNPIQNPGISIKLSALYSRYDYTQHAEVLNIIPPLLLSLAQLAKKYNIGLTVDAEEADRLDLSLDIFEKVFMHPSLNGWEGLGLAIQAYQKRTSFVIDWLAYLSARAQKRIMVRLVKGAYWDAEIKSTQIQGFNNYPVFTRKNSTDVSYIACAKKLLAKPQYFYPQFGTHNAYSIAAILEMTNAKTEFEFQCLHGMGEALYDQIVDKNKFDRACRIYAPVGTHKDLLGYLVRRLLENGANSSFLNNLSNENIPLEKIINDPVARIKSLNEKPHPRIPLPKNLYGAWENSLGLDLSNEKILATLKNKMQSAVQEQWFASSLINGKNITHHLQVLTAPQNNELVIGQVSKACKEDVLTALTHAEQGFSHWKNMDYEKRAAILERAADLFQEALPELMAILTREGGKCILDCQSEIRETIDYCRYYAYRARIDLKPQILPGPTGEENVFSLHPRGIIACISPWNFPLAIFTGQIVAALVTGNVVIAKPAEQTPLIAYKAVQILHAAGVPQDALQLLIGRGSEIGAQLVGDPRIAGVMFTGSTQTAKSIEQTLATRSGPIAIFIAETGGQNAMIVDSSALCEQVVVDVVQSAFNSAGQRCSALRVLFVQEEFAPKFIEMLAGFMQELKMGDPALLKTDVGPVIDANALSMLQNHAREMDAKATLLAEVPMQTTLPGYYFAPCAFEIADLGLLQGEIFGPILHIIRYKAHELDQVIQSIIDTGYGLTFGIHSRIDATVNYVLNRMPVGNIYVNRNMIGAVVGVQPFGGERLSGTGPKAGGPYYLPRLCVERTVSINTTAIGGNARLVSLLEEGF